MLFIQHTLYTKHANSFIIRKRLGCARLSQNNVRFTYPYAFRAQSAHTLVTE